jgi:hypothetical protein
MNRGRGGACGRPCGGGVRLDGGTEGLDLAEAAEPWGRRGDAGPKRDAGAWPSSSAG